MIFWTVKYSYIVLKNRFASLTPRRHASVYKGFYVWILPYHVTTPTIPVKHISGCFILAKHIFAKHVVDSGLGVTLPFYPKSLICTLQNLTNKNKAPGQHRKH